MGLKLKCGYEIEKEKITSVILYKKDKSIFNELICDIKSFKDKDISYIYSDIEEVFTCKIVREELSYPLYKYNYKNSTVEKRVLDSLKLVNLPSDYIDRDINTLSSGEKVLVLIASRMILNPKLIIFNLDNIFMYLDDRNVKYIIRLLKRLKNNYHKTIVLFSSNIDNTLDISDNFVLFKNNNIVYSGNKKNLLYNIDIIKKEGFVLPKIIEFIDYVKKKKNIQLEVTSDIKELMKDIYRNVK